jgi:hypothetical protein
MVPLLSLAIPIVLSAVIVFVASSIIHMVLPYHRSDYGRIAKEEDIQEMLRRLNVAPGDYAIPYGGSPSAMKDPGFMEKATKGPRVIMSVTPGGPLSMGKNLVQWFLFCVLVSLFSAYIASRTLSSGTDYRVVFRLVSTVAFMGYALALPLQSIWFMRKWSTTFKSMADGLLYGLLTGGTFGWLWPR